MERNATTQLRNEAFRSPERRREWSLIACQPVRITDLTGDLVPASLRPDPPTRLDQLYANLANTPSSLFVASRRGSTDKEFIMVGPQLTPEQVNGLLYFAAPYKGFGLDTRDIINDWTDLYTDPEHEQRRERHARFPGWDYFDASRGRILNVLQANFNGKDFSEQDPSDGIIPVLRWKRDEHGNNRIILGEVDEELQSAIIKELPEYGGYADRFDSGMGIMHLAAYSPDNTKKWPKKFGKIQTNGPTQVLAYAYAKLVKQQEHPKNDAAEEDIQQSILLDGLSDYATTGEFPQLSVKGFRYDSYFPFSRETATPALTKARNNYLSKRAESVYRRYLRHEGLFGEFHYGFGDMVRITRFTDSFVADDETGESGRIVSEKENTEERGISLWVGWDYGRSWTTLYMPTTTNSNDQKCLTGDVYTIGEKGKATRATFREAFPALRRARDALASKELFPSKAW